MSNFNKLGWGKVLLSTMLLFGLYGCGNEAEDKADLNNDLANTATVVAQDAMYSTGFSDQYQVDLTSRVLVSDGSEFIVTDVEELSPGDECDVQSINDTGFVIAAQSLKVCDYRYQVASKLSTENESQALLRVAVSKTPEQAQLPPISAVTLLNTAIDVDLAQELSKLGVDLDGFTLSSETTLPFNSGSEASTNPVNNILTYTPAADFEGIDRVLFTYSNGSDQVLMGVLDVAVAYEANKGLTIQDNIVYPQRVSINQKVDIDISPYVTSEDGDDYQLVYVGAFNAEVAAKNPTDTNNKVFTFQSSLVGEHTVSFAVSDHNGAYEMGLIKVITQDPAQSAKWGDIVYGVNRFTAPTTAADANYLDIPYSAILVDDGYDPAINMTAYSYQDAKTLCTNLGAKLATADQLERLASNVDVSGTYNWPVKYKYIADQSGSGVQVDITGAEDSTAADANVYYLSCVFPGQMSIVESDSDFEAVANGVDTATVSVKLDFGGSDNSGKVISASSDSSNVTFSSTATTNASGVATFSFTDFKAESINVTFNYVDLQINTHIVFIGDEKTAVLTLATIVDGSDFGSEPNKVRATLRDANNNPIEKRIVNFSSTSTDVAISADTETDTKGEQDASIRWAATEPSVSQTVGIDAKYNRSDGMTLNASTNVQFIKESLVCGGLYNDTNMTNASGPCLKVARRPGTNYLYTSTPSVAFMDAVGYRYSTDQIRTEDGSRGPAGGGFMSWNYSLANVDAGRDWCEKLSEIEFSGRSNWQLSRTNISLYLGNMYTYFGWPTSSLYSGNATLPEESVVIAFDYFTGWMDGGSYRYAYVSCVSHY